jgi:hypothetical protein
VADDLWIARTLPVPLGIPGVKKPFARNAVSRSRKVLKMRVFSLITGLLITINLYGQPDSVYTQGYLDKSTRFAWLTYGGDLNYLSGGTTQQLINGTKQATDFGATVLPRLTIGGIHFWGHADFYVSFPLSFLTLQDVPRGLEDLEVYQGVETGMRLYPLKLEPRRVSPFLGISFRRIRFAQAAVESNSSNGVPGYGRIIYPIQAGLTYTTKQWHLSPRAIIITRTNSIISPRRPNRSVCNSIPFPSI